eukprot:COSAG04_NODE_381_length_15461_cov_843.360370_9_plen_42_part_00
MVQRATMTITTKITPMFLANVATGGVALGVAVYNFAACEPA